MAELVDAESYELETDFAILMVTQDSSLSGMPLSGLAWAEPGHLELRPIYKYAHIALRLERWTSAPPDDPADWEEFDELPWLSLPGDRPVEVCGFDDADGRAFPVPQGPSRVRVSAWGRCRYFYGSDGRGLPPERWLVQIWPEGGPADQPAVRPPRIGTPTLRAIESWRATGWVEMLAPVGWFLSLLAFLLRFNGSFSREEVAAQWSLMRADVPEGEDFGELVIPWDDPVLVNRPVHGHTLAEAAERLAILERAGFGATHSVADLWRLMVNVGLLETVEAGPDRFVLGSVTEPVWDRVALPEPLLATVRSAARIATPEY